MNPKPIISLRPMMGSLDVDCIVLDKKEGRVCLLWVADESASIVATVPEHLGQKLLPGTFSALIQ